MPDAAGNIKGTGWSRKGEAAWERVFGRPETQQCSVPSCIDGTLRVAVDQGASFKAVPCEQCTAAWALEHAGTQRTDEHVPTFDELPPDVQARVDPRSVPRFDPAAAGRRAVEKHGDALARLSDA